MSSERGSAVEPGPPLHLSPSALWLRDAGSAAELAELGLAVLVSASWAMLGTWLLVEHTQASSRMIPTPGPSR